MHVRAKMEPAAARSLLLGRNLESAPSFGAPPAEELLPGALRRKGQAC